jgi:fatty acid desaturase
MKHWDRRDLPEAIELRPDAPAAARLRDQLRQSPKPRRAEPQIASLIGLVLAVGLLATLGWALAPSSPVSPQLLD